MVGTAIAWFRWSRYPLTVQRKITSVEFILGLLISGVFLVSARSATPEGNQKRLWGLLWVMMFVQVIQSVLQ